MTEVEVEGTGVEGVVAGAVMQDLMLVVLACMWVVCLLGPEAVIWKIFSRSMGGTVLFTLTRDLLHTVEIP